MGGGLRAASFDAANKGASVESYFLEEWEVIAIARIEKGQLRLFSGFHPIHPEWTGYEGSAVVWHATEEDALWNIQMMRSGVKGSFCSSLGSVEIQSEPVKARLFLLRKLP